MVIVFRKFQGPDYMNPVRTLTGTTQIGTIKFTWVRSESMKWLYETGNETRRKLLFFFCGLLHCAFLLNAALLIRIQVKERKKERIIQNKRRWRIAPGWTDCWWMKMWNDEALSLIFFRLFPLSAILEWSNNALAHAQNSDLWSQISLCWQSWKTIAHVTNSRGKTGKHITKMAEFLKTWIAPREFTSDKS